MAQSKLEILLTLRDEATQRMKDFGKTTEGQATLISTAFKAVSVAAVTAFAVDTVRSVMRAANEIQSLSDRTGVAVEQISELRVISRFTGVSLDQMATAFRQMQLNMTDTGATGQTFRVNLQALGLSFEDIQRLSPDRQFAAIAAALGQVEDPARFAAMSVEMFGRSGGELAPLFRRSNEELEQFIAWGRQAGVVMDQDMVDKAQRAADQFTRLSLAWEGVKWQIGAPMAGAAATVITNILGQREAMKQAEGRAFPRMGRAVQGAWSEFGALMADPGHGMLNRPQAPPVIINLPPSSVVFADNAESVRQLAEAVKTASADIDRGGGR